MSAPSPAGGSEPSGTGRPAPAIGGSGAAKVLQAERPPGEGHGRAQAPTPTGSGRRCCPVAFGALTSAASRTGTTGPPSPGRRRTGEPERLRFAVLCARCARDHIVGAARVSTLTRPCVHPEALAVGADVGSGRWRCLGSPPFVRAPSRSLSGRRWGPWWPGGRPRRTRAGQLAPPEHAAPEPAGVSWVCT